MANAVVSALKTPWTLVREYLHRMPERDFNWSFGESSLRRRAQPYVEKLRREGIVMLPGHFQGETLARLKAAFEPVVADKPFASTPDCFVNTQFMTADPVFLQAGLDELLLEIVGGYYRKKFGIGRVSAMRILPTPPSRAHAQWHHDTRGRQLHLMILLGDVSPQGQRMSYLRQSHTRYYTRARAVAEGSRFENDMRRQLHEQPDLKERIVEVAGPAGTAAIFDANGLHTVNRNQADSRDTITFCYVSYRHFKTITYRRGDVARLSPQQQKVITFNPHAQLVD